MANLPEALQREVFDLPRFHRRKDADEHFNGLLLSESALAKDWNTPEEDGRMPLGKPVVGEVVVLLFPQTNWQAGRRRPALVVADLKGDELIRCQEHRAAWSGGCEGSPSWLE